MEARQPELTEVELTEAEWETHFGSRSTPRPQVEVAMAAEAPAVPVRAGG